MWQLCLLTSRTRGGRRNVEANRDMSELQGKESKEQAILEEIKKKAQGEGSGATADHSSSSNDSPESANDAKTGSERDSDHDKSDNDSKHRNEIDKSDSD
ncbi:hypothetical protein Tco_0020852 [Tanacetum coccineum]